MRRRKNEYTPKEIATLADTLGDARALREHLLRAGYKDIDADGCFKAVYRYPRGRYVVKVAPENEFHITEQNRSFQHFPANKRRKIVTLLAFGPFFQVQRYVTPCNKEGCGPVRGVPDTKGHNHCHIGARILAFDWLIRRGGW